MLELVAIFSFQALDASREELCSGVLKKLGIDSALWGDVVSQRPIRLLGEKRPWDITHAVCTVTERNGVRLRASFGDTLKGTQALKLTVECLIDVKRNVTLPVDLEVEVGVPFCCIFCFSP